MAVAQVINVVIVPGAIDPCIGVARGVHVGAKQGAQFMLNIGFAYTVNGARVRIGPVAVPLRGAKEVQRLDPITVQVESRVAIKPTEQPDHNQNITAAVFITCIDTFNNNDVVRVGATETSQHYVP